MKKLIGLFIFFFLVGCGREKGLDVYQPQEEFEKITAASNEVPEIRVTPQVDILFVIDDSESMKEEIDKLSKNIPKFVKAFTKYQQLDFHIGVTTVWDSVRYQDSALNPNGPVPQFTEVTKDDGSKVQRRNFWSKGELLPLVSEKSPDSLSDVYAEGVRFVSSNTENLEQKLINTLLVSPVKHIAGRENENDSDSPYIPGAGQGPEFEELFSPVKAAFSSPLLNNPSSGPNQGFSRIGSHKVVVYLTDADDESQSISASQLDQFLRQLTRDNTRSSFSTYSVMFRNEDQGEIKNSCKPDPGLYEDPRAKTKFIGADKLTEFMKLTQGTSYSICKEFGEKLASLGESVVEQALGNIVIPLNRYPQYLAPKNEENIASWLKVYYGSEQIPLLSSIKVDGSESEVQFGWSWDFDRNSIVIRGANLLTPVAGAEFKIEFTAVDLKNNSNGGVTQSF